MQDHLRAAAQVAAFSDAQLVSVRIGIKDWEHPTALEGAALDELARRRERPRIKA